MPFLTALAPSERYCKENCNKHKKITDWAMQIIILLGRWLPGRKVIVVADSSYSALELLSATKDKATIITRLRLDAALYEQALPTQCPGKWAEGGLKAIVCPHLSSSYPEVSCSDSSLSFRSGTARGTKRWKLAVAQPFGTIVGNDRSFSRY